MKRSRLVLVIGALAVILVTPGAALADAPTNDLITSATLITALPFAAEQDTTEANADGPTDCVTNNASVFYRFVPTEDVRVQVDALGSEYNTVVGVYRGPLKDLQRIKCQDWGFGWDAAVRFDAQAGVRYFIMAAGRRSGGGALDVTVTEVPAEPFDVELVATTATIEPISGDLQVEGTVECTHRSVVNFGGTVRQRRDDLFVAQAYFEGYIECTEAGTWSAEAQISGNIGFASGNARVRIGYDASDAFKWISEYRGDAHVISIA
jgi:hypothetical protein